MNQISIINQYYFSDFTDFFFSFIMWHDCQESIDFEAYNKLLQRKFKYKFF